MALSDRLAVWSLVLGGVGLLVTIVGFVIAIVQLTRTKNATESTRVAIEAANARMVLNHLLAALPQLESVESDLDAAIIADDRMAASRALLKYSHLANQVSALLKAGGGDDGASLVAKLDSSARSATLVKGSLVSGSKRALKTLVGEVAAEIADVAGACSGLATSYRTKVAV